MNNLLSYCGLVVARTSASEKDLPVMVVSFEIECGMANEISKFGSNMYNNFVCPIMKFYNWPWMIIIIPAKIKENDNIVPWEFSKRVNFHIALILIKVRCRPNKCQFTWLSSSFNWRNSIPVKISPVAIGWVHVNCQNWFLNVEDRMYISKSI